MALVGFLLVVVGITTVPVVLLVERLATSPAVGHMTGGTASFDAGMLDPLAAGSRDVLGTLFGMLRNAALVFAGLLTGVGVSMFAVGMVRRTERGR